MTYLGIILFALAPVQAATPDIADWQSVLSNHVNDRGEVRYAALKADSAALERYVTALGQASPESHPALFPTRESKLAYWINAYNALVLHGMVRDYPERKTRLESRLSRAAFFYRTKFTVGGKERTLAHIEDHHLREEIKDPRIHFAIVCASRGCPWLSRKAYTPENVDAALESAAKRFFSEERNLRIDAGRRMLRVSSIFKWFERDFGATTAERIAFIARYRPAEAGLLRQGTWKFEYVDWDWSINDAAAR